MSLAGIAVLIAAVIAIVLVTSGGSAKTPSPAVASNSAISLRHTSLGQTLVDANGRTLYLFEGDKHNLSTLSAAGQAIWPPFVAGARPRALGGALASEIGTIKQAGGRFQISYDGHPLYYYVADHAAGQTLGQGLNQFGALWYVLGRNGRAVTSAPSSSAPASSVYGY
jgi:predicted lipoprotein with Yx(FWY)xxD motif